MKKATLLHGTDGTAGDHWFPWIKDQLEAHGYEVFAPQLPGCHTPNRNVYEDFLRASGWDFSDNVLIGHSSGATTVLNLLSSDWFPSVKTAVLVAAFLNERLVRASDWYEPGQFDNLFLDGYNPAIIKSKADSFLFVHGDNDPYCDMKDAHMLCNEVGGDFVAIKNGHHLGSGSGLTELPGVMEKLEGII